MKQPGRAPFTRFSLLLSLLTLACGQPADDGYNVILIVPDTLRADALGVYGGGEGASPEIDALAARALLAERAFSQAPWTPPSMASLLSGTYQSVHGVVQNAGEESRLNVLNERFDTLAETFARNGFETAGFSAQPWVHPSLGFTQGFAHYSIVSSLEDPRSTERVTLAAIEWLASNSHRRFFLFLNYLQPHDPYEAPPPFDHELWRRPIPPRISALSSLGWKPKSDFLVHGDEPGPNHVSEEELEYLRAAYLQQVRYVDWWIGTLVRRLDSLKLRDKTIIALTSDHGESFLEHGQLHHITHLYNENLHVPWVISNPRLFEQQQRISRPIEQMDMAPTLLSLLKIPVPPGMQGFDQTVARASERDVYSEGEQLRSFKFQNSQRSCIVTAVVGSPMRIELYDLTADAAESVDVAAARPQQAEECRVAALRRYRDDLQLSSKLKKSVATLDEESRRTLEALGYLH